MDIDSCEPVPETYLEFWNANALGIYSGVVAKGNGDYNDKSNVVSRINAKISIPRRCRLHHETRD